MQTPKTRSPTRRAALRSISSLVLILLGLAGCGGGSNDSGNNPSSTTRQVVERTEGPFHIVASVPKRSYKKGEAVEITFSVTNLSSGRLLISALTSNTNSSADYGGKLGQFAVQQSDKKVFDSLPGGAGAENLSAILEAGTTTTETYRWAQSDIGAYLPLHSPYQKGVLDPNTAASGTYQVVPRFNAVGVATYDQSLPSEYTPLNGGQAVTLPPLSVTVEP